MISKKHRIIFRNLYLMNSPMQRKRIMYINQNTFRQFRERSRKFHLLQQLAVQKHILCNCFCSLRDLIKYRCPASVYTDQNLIPVNTESVGSIDRITFVNQKRAARSCDVIYLPDTCGNEDLLKSRCVERTCPDLFNPLFQNQFCQTQTEFKCGRLDYPHSTGYMNPLDKQSVFIKSVSSDCADRQTSDFIGNLNTCRVPVIGSHTQSVRTCHIIKFITHFFNLCFIIPFQMPLLPAAVRSRGRAS